MRTIPIAFAFDSNFILPAKICISSLLMNAKTGTFYDIFILYEQEQVDEDFDKLVTTYGNCRIQVRAIKNFGKKYEVRNVTTAAYYRLLIPELIPEYDKIIYSDVDVIFQSDLSEIYETTDLEGYYLAGVNSLSHLNADFDSYYREILHLDSTRIIYDGNIILNSKKMREDNLVERFSEHFEKKYKYQDMDIINLVCKDRIKYLPPMFCYTIYINYCLIFYDQKKGMYTPQEKQDAITFGTVHYCGPKPWNTLCANFDIWWEYYRKSIFFDPIYYYQFYLPEKPINRKSSLLKKMKDICFLFLDRAKR